MRVTTLRISLLSLLSFLLIAVPAHADPVLLETGIFTQSVFLVLIAGLGIEILILKLFTRRPVIEIGAAVLLVNAVTGFIGFVGVLLANLQDLPILPPGPLALAAALIEIPLLIWILNKARIQVLIPGVLTANAVTLIFALIIIAPAAIDPPDPGPQQDFEMNRALAEIKTAVNEYYNINGFYPEALIGGSDITSEISSSPDPLIASGLLTSYPANPYAPFLRSQTFNLKFLLSGLGDPTRVVGLDRPVNDWENRWFPRIQADPRFSDLHGTLLCANGLSDSRAIETLSPTFYHMNGTDFIPGCFIYKSFDFDLDGAPDDYILGAYGWPTGTGTVLFDFIDGSNGDVSLALNKYGQIIAGAPDGNPEALLTLYVRGAYD